MSKLTLAQANTIINAAIDAARASGGPPIAVVVVDDGGHVKASQREDGAAMFRIDVSLGKALGDVAMDTPSGKGYKLSLVYSGFDRHLGMTHASQSW